MEGWFNRIWYERRQPPFWLLPFEALFIALSGLRRFFYRAGFLSVRRVDCPVIVVGNIAVGGTGKTPLVLHLSRRLQEAGWSPGIVSRGHGAGKLLEPIIVDARDSAPQVGDEPLMMFQLTGIPVCVFPDRYRAAKHLLANRPVDVLIADDGLQHMRLHRDVEIAVVDGMRGLGNGHRIPAGPLRETAARLAEVDLVISQGDWKAAKVPVSAKMQLRPAAFVRLKDGFRAEIEQGLPQELESPVAAVAGIGNPQRFFDSLAVLGVEAETHAFPDHYAYRPEDFAFAGARAVIMTAKDAVKCRDIARDNWWYLDVEPSFDVDPAMRVSGLLVMQGYQPAMPEKPNGSPDGQDAS